MDQISGTQTGNGNLSVNLRLKSTQSTCPVSFNAFKCRISQQKYLIANTVLTINVYVGTAYTQLLISSSRNFKVTLNKGSNKRCKGVLKKWNISKTEKQQKTTQ